MLSIWNQTSGTTGGDLIVEIIYVDDSPGASLLPPKIRRVNLGSGTSVAGFHDDGLVNLRASVSPGKTFVLEGVELREGNSVMLSLSDNGFEYQSE